MYIVSVVIIFQTFFYQLNFKDKKNAKFFFLSRYRSLINFLLLIIIIGIFFGYIFEIILLVFFILIEIYRRNLTQLGNIRESLLYGLCFQSMRLLSLLILQPQELTYLFKILILVSMPFILISFINVLKNKYTQGRSVLSKDDAFISLTSALGTIQFYIPIFSSNLFFSKEMAASIIAVRFFANITNIFAELIEYGFRETFKYLQSIITFNVLIPILIFIVISSTLMYFATDVLLPIFFPKTSIYNELINYSLIAVIFWVGQMLHIAQRVLSYHFNYNGDFKITFFAQLISISITAIYFIALFYIENNDLLFYTWAFGYILMPLITSIAIFSVHKREI